MESFTLLPRQLLGRDFIIQNNTCPWTPSLYESPAQPLFGNVTFYRFNTIFSGICAAVAILTIHILGFLHSTHFSRPAEQVKILRIMHLIPAYSIYSWLTIYYPETYNYLQPALELVQGIALCSFFLLLLEFVSNSEDQRSLFFAGIDIRDRKKDKKASSGRHYDTPEKRLMWYRHKWIAIFQYPIVSVFVLVVTDITEALGRFCENSFSPQFANLWMFLLSNASVTLAVTAILVTYGNLKVHLKHHKPLSKLITFKLVVGLGFIQQILFTILRDAKVMVPTATLTYADIQVGIPTMVTCVEMVPIAFLFHYAYSYKPYCLDERQPVPVAESAVAPPTPISSYQGGFLGYRAILLAIDPREIFSAFFFAFKMGNEEMQRYISNSKEGQGDGMEPLRGDTSYQSGPHYGQDYETEYPPASMPVKYPQQFLGRQPGFGRQPGYAPEPGYGQQPYHGRPSYNA